jgi:acetyl-CoA decarbonylase/synthase complex subunit gamma
MPEKLGPLDIYNLLPKTNCGKCAEKNCMAFATRLIERSVTIEQCPPILEEKYRKNQARLHDLLRPPVKEVIIGSGDRATKIGGKLVMYRHELTYHNPTAIAVDVTDEMPEDQLLKRVKAIEGYSITRIGESLKLNLIAVRSTSNDPAKFGKTVKTIVGNSQMPLILCSLEPNVLEAGLVEAKGRRPLVYAATKDNWKEVAELALMYNCPVVVFAPNDAQLLRSMAGTMLKYGVEDLVLDPGTFADQGMTDTLDNFTMVRQAAFEKDDRLLGFPMIGVPMVVWSNDGDAPETTAWTEAVYASMLLTRYADVLIVHSLEPWTILPIMTLRQNIYTDPRKPTAVEAGLRVYGQVDENSPVMMTSNFSLTFYTVENDIETAKINCYLIVVDTEGLSVQSAVAGRKLTAEKVAEAIKKVGIEGKVKHKKLIIPQFAARLRGDLEDMSGWEVLVGPQDSSGIPQFLQQYWYKK